MLTLTFGIFIFQLACLSFLVFMERRNIYKSASWFALVLSFPVLGLVLYVYFGWWRSKESFFEKYNRKLAHSAHKPDVLPDGQVASQGVGQGMPRIVTNLYGVPVAANNKVTVLLNGEEKFRVLLEALSTATKHIHIEYYIYRDDNIGREVFEILKQKASEGVAVRLIVDGLGSRAIRKQLAKEMIAAGIQVAVFFPLKFPYLSPRLNYRNHRKIVIIDGRQAFTGGLNVGDEYLSRDPKYGFWRDTHLAVEGDGVRFFQDVFRADWRSVTGEELKGTDLYPAFKPVGTSSIHILASGPNLKLPLVLHTLFFSIMAAKERICIETPYLILEESIVAALKAAALAGVRVDLLVQGVPEHKPLYWAAHSYYEDLLEFSINIYEYKKGILHTKVVIIDGEFARVGSANLDIRSFFYNFEAGVLIYDKGVAADLLRAFDDDLKDSTKIDKSKFFTRPFVERSNEVVFRLLAPLL